MTRLMVIEDDENLRELLVELLEDEGYSVGGAANADEALALAKKHKPELVLSDVRMPGSLDGLGALTELKKANKELLTIVMTGFAREDGPQRALHLLVDDYLIKPIQREEVVAAVTRVLHSKQEEDRYRGLWGSLLSTLASEKIKRQRQEEALDTGRDQFYRTFYVAVRAQHLLTGIALEIWDQLELVEARQHELACQGVEQDVDALTKVREAYAHLRQAVANASRDETLGSHRSRKEGQLSYPSFGQFLRRVQEGYISQEQLKIACVLRGYRPDALGEPFHSLRRLLWDEQYRPLKLA